MSISSSFVTNLTNWRNPQGAEENWKGREYKYSHLPSLKKIAISEVGFAAIGLAALAETVVNAAFILFSLPFRFIHPDSTKLPIERLKSSAFIAIWSAVNLVMNLGVSNMTAKEETAHSIASNIYRSFIQRFA